jgi:hypothetical protein
MQEQQRPSTEEKAPKIKQPYEKPQLRPVKLFADQVLGGCKITAGVCTVFDPNFS